MKLDGKKALVTGAAGGIGSAVVAELLRGGVDRVVVCDLNADSLERIRAFDPARVEPALLDVTDEAAIAELARAHGDTDILINCHGLAVHLSYLEAESLSAFRREMEVNYWGQVMMCLAFAPVLARTPGGVLVNFLSPLAYVTFPFVAAYCATKAACRVLTEALRAELAQSGTLVMAVYPGSIDTPMMAHVQVPKGRPEDVAEAVVLGINHGTEDVWAGEGAQDMRRMLAEDPAGILANAATLLRLSDINQAGTPIAQDA